MCSHSPSLLILPLGAGPDKAFLVQIARLYDLHITYFGSSHPYIDHVLLHAFLHCKMSSFYDRKIEPSDHGTLEVVEPPHEGNEKIVYIAPLTGPTTGKIIASEYYAPDVYPIPSQQQPGQQQPGQEQPGLQVRDTPPSKILGLQKRLFVILLILAAVILTLALGLGLGLTLRDRDTDAGAESSTSPTNPNDFNTSNGSNSTSAVHIDFAPADGFLPATSLATMNFTFDGGQVHYTYWQTADGDIVESAWYNGARSWTTNEVTKNIAGIPGGMKAKKGTPISATAWVDEATAGMVGGPAANCVSLRIRSLTFGMQQLNLYFITTQGSIQDLWRSGGTGKWNRGDIGTSLGAAQAYPASESKLLAYWEYCAMCRTQFSVPRLHLMYINQAGNLQHWNSSFHYTWKPDVIEIDGAAPLESTGISMTEVSVGSGSELRAYYATKDHIQEIFYDEPSAKWQAGASHDLEIARPHNS
jgi:hypothetical protein